MRLLAILLSLVFFHYFPILVLASYMTWEGFFSYDMFTGGLSGATAFYWWTEAIFLIGAAYVSGSLYFIKEHRIKKGNGLPIRSVYFWWFAIINVVLLSLMAIAGLGSGDSRTQWSLLGTLAICSWISIHVATAIHGRAKDAFRSLLFGVFILTTVAFLVPGALAFPYSLSLQYFGNGGGIAATLTMAKNAEEVKGRLALNSPDYVYLYKDGDNQISIIPRRDIKEISISNLSGFGHGKSRERQSRREQISPTTKKGAGER